jgi:transcriptional regulator
VKYLCGKQERKHWANLDLQGTLDLMVLQTLAAIGAQHGYGIARRIEQASGDEVLLNQGTIYASLVRLQQRGWIDAEWGTSDNNRKAKFYSITRSGREQLEKDAALLAAIVRRDGPSARHDSGRQPLMSNLRRAMARVRSFFSKPPLDADLEAEIAAHLEMAIEENIQRGLTPLEARRQAFIRFGGIDLAKDQHREARGLMKLDILLQDLKLHLPHTGRDRGFTLVAILILALGIGANIAVFSVVNTLLCARCPFPMRSSWSWIAPPPTKCGLSCATYSTDAYDEFRTYTHSFQDVTGYFAFSSPGNLKLSLGRRSHSRHQHRCHRKLLSGARRATGHGPRFQAGRRAQRRCPGDGAFRCLVASPVQRRPKHRRQGVRHERPRRPPSSASCRKLRLWRGLFARRKGRRHHAAQSLRPSPQLGKHHHLHRPLKPGVSLSQAQQDAAAAAPHMCWNNKQPNSCGSTLTPSSPCRLKDYVSGKLHRSLSWSSGPPSA